jgi:hypothetical protein
MELIPRSAQQLSSYIKALGRQRRHRLGQRLTTSKAEADAVKAGKAFRPVSLPVLGRYPVLAADFPIAYRVTEARGAGDPITD